MRCLLNKYLGQQIDERGGLRARRMNDDRQGGHRKVAPTRKDVSRI